MSESSSTVRNLGRQYRAPSRHGEVLSVPELHVAAKDAQANSERLSLADIEIGNQDFSEIRSRARTEIITKAVEWTNRITGQAIACAECSHHAALLFVTGHQPQLAHAGVWAKNIAASGLAANSQGLGLNIIVDNDTVGTQVIQVPTGTREKPQYKDISFDEAQPQQPWEELKIQNRELFESFATRVSDEIQHWGIQPIVNEMWATAVTASQKTDSMVECLAACRIEQERKWGVRNLELPLSEICQTESFLEFLQHIILHAGEFHASYNSIVEKYRLENGIRNDRHPVPDLESSNGAMELPFWFWRENDVERGQVFVKVSDGLIQLLCRNEVILEATSESLLRGLRTLQKNGKLRTRALTTTLFARLFLADLFIHGIGGAKYDEITDLLISEFYGITPPNFLVLSATLHLPISGHAVSDADVLSLKRKLRDFEYNGDRYLDTDEADDLRSQKEELIRQHWMAQTTNLSKQERIKFRRKNRQRHLELKRVNSKLCELAQSEMQILQEELEEAESRLRANSTLKNREFSAVIFPEKDVKQLAEQLLQGEESPVDCGVSSLNGN